MKPFELPRIGFGCWDDVAQLVKDGNGLPPPPDAMRDDRSVSILKSAIDAGYRHFDTAEMYGAGHSETMLGRALQGSQRDEFLVTTKVNPANLAYTDLLAACDRSLSRLQLSYVDMYMIHKPNPDVPLEDTFRGLNELVADGKIRQIAVSNFDVPMLERAVSLSETPIATNQVFYNLLHRGPVETGLLGFCQENDILLTAYAPLRLGVLTHPAVVDIAHRSKATPAQVGLQWLIGQDGVVTIPHSGNPSRQRDNLAATAIVLSQTDLAQLDAAIT